MWVATIGPRARVGRRQQRRRGQLSGVLGTESAEQPALPRVRSEARVSRRRCAHHRNCRLRSLDVAVWHCCRGRGSGGRGDRGFLARDTRAGAAAPGTSSPTPATSLGSTSSTTPSRSGPLTPATISASTELSDEFGVDNLTDGDLSSAWNDASLHGDGATLTFDFGREVILDEIVITNLADEARFQRNFRVREYSIEIDGLAETIAGELGDVSGRQAIDIGGRNATKVTMRIVSTYAASELEGSPPFDELAIAEVSFTGR